MSDDSIVCRGMRFRDEDDAYDYFRQRELDEQAEPAEEIKVVHVVGPLGEAKCPQCGSLHEDEGGEVSRRGSWDWGPFYWECDACGHQWGHA